MMESHALAEILRRFHRSRILVVGDIIIDHFIWGTVSRISPEAPVPVVNVTREERLLGGSANVLRNILSLGGQATLCGLIGSDEQGQEVRRQLQELGVSTDGLAVASRPTTVKTRVVAQGQQVVRFDREETGEPDRTSLAQLIGYLEKHIHTFDGVVVSDYAKGVVNEELMIRLHQLLATMCHDRPLPLVVDPKPANVHRFVGATVITPNHHELEMIAGMALQDDSMLLAAARQLREDLDCQAVLITRGEAGMALLSEAGELVSIPTSAKEVYDVTGAGDTVVATLALGLALGAPMRHAAMLANRAAGIVVGKVGTATVTTDELLQDLA